MKKKVVKEILEVITEKGFEVKSINEENGIINTEWRPVKDESGTQMLQVVFVDISVKVTRYISLAIKIDESCYKIRVQAKQTQVSKLRNSSKDEFKELTQKEMEFIEGLMDTVNNKLGLDKNYLWQIEEIGSF